MSHPDSAGLSALAALLSRIADERRPTVAEIVRDTGIARATGFALARKLEMAGLLARNGSGQAMPGPALVRLAFSAYGLAPLHGPAEALLTLLRDETDASASLVATGEQRVVVLRLAARWDHGEPMVPLFVSPVRDGSGTERAVLELTLRPDATRIARTLAQAEFERTRASLEHYLQEGR